MTSTPPPPSPIHPHRTAPFPCALFPLKAAKSGCGEHPSRVPRLPCKADPGQAEGGRIFVSQASSGEDAAVLDQSRVRSAGVKASSNKVQLQNSFFSPFISCLHGRVLRADSHTCEEISAENRFSWWVRGGVFNIGRCSRNGGKGTRASG